MLVICFGIGVWHFRLLSDEENGGLNRYGTNGKASNFKASVLGLSFNVNANIREHKNARKSKKPSDDPLWQKLPYRVENIATGTSTEEASWPPPIIPHPNGYHVETLAGDPVRNGGYQDGMGTCAHFDTPGGSVGVDTTDGTLYLADSYNQRIRKIQSNGEVTTIAGTGREGSDDGVGSMSTFAYPYAVAVSPDGSIYVSDTGNNAIRKLSLLPNGTTYNVTTVYSATMSRVLTKDPPPAEWLRSPFPNIQHPCGIDVDENGLIYVANALEHNILRIEDDASSDHPNVDIIGGHGTLTEVLTLDLDIEKVGLRDGEACRSSMDRPQGLSVRPQSGDVYVADTWNERIRKIAAPDNNILGSARVSTIAGYTGTTSVARDGLALISTFGGVFDCAFCEKTENLYIAEKYNNRIRCLTPEGKVTTICGGQKGLGDGIGLESRFNLPSGVAVHDGFVYVTDTTNHCIRKISRDDLMPC